MKKRVINKKKQKVGENIDLHRPRELSNFKSDSIPRSFSFILFLKMYIFDVW